MTHAILQITPPTAGETLEGIIYKIDSAVRLEMAILDLKCVRDYDILLIYFP